MGLFLFGPGLEQYLRERSSRSTSTLWARFYDGLGDIVVEAGTDPQKAVQLADALYYQIWGGRRPRRRRALTSGSAPLALGGTGRSE